MSFSRYLIRATARWVMSMPIHARPSFCAARDGRPAAAERVEHHVAGIAAGADDALQKSQGLLGGVAEAFG